MTQNLNWGRLFLSTRPFGNTVLFLSKVNFCCHVNRKTVSSKFNSDLPFYRYAIVRLKWHNSGALSCKVPCKIGTLLLQLHSGSQYEISPHFKPQWVKIQNLTFFPHNSSDSEITHHSDHCDEMRHFFGFWTTVQLLVVCCMMSLFL